MKKILLLFLSLIICSCSRQVIPLETSNEHTTDSSFTNVPVVKTISTEPESLITTLSIIDKQIKTTGRFEKNIKHNGIKIKVVVDSTGTLIAEAKADSLQYLADSLTIRIKDKQVTKIIQSVYRPCTLWYHKAAVKFSIFILVIISALILWKLKKFTI